MSFASKFGVKAAESDAKGLQSTEWEAVVHSEDLTGDLAKLEHHVVLCAGGGACIAQSVHCTVCVCACVCVRACVCVHTRAYGLTHGPTGSSLQRPV